ncbi:MAG: PKD domain-containing protein [Bacteroidetes bacterium]|nr:PKD domain-containing protein [Bacteroidota bacterium]
MKKRRSFLCLTVLLLVFSIGFAQQPGSSLLKKRIIDQVDNRVDNLNYWMKMAGKGLTPYNPPVQLVPAVFKGDRIIARGVKTANSPDIPVTGLANVTESENSLFVDPDNADHLLNSNNSTSWTGSAYGTIYGANYFKSSNSGIGWSGSQYGAGGTNGGDPAAAIGLNGREYVNFINIANGQGIAYSDNGTSWTSSAVAPNPGDLCDKNHMWIDNKSTSPYEGNLYVAWTDFGGTDDSEIKISRSIDNGIGWSAPLCISTAVNAGNLNQGVNLQTGPGGEVYAAWAIYDSWPADEKAIGFAKSNDGGVSYSAATRVVSNIRGIRKTAVSKNHRVNSYPVMAVDISGGPNNGNIYIVWTNTGSPGINTGTNKSVYLVRSTNGGATWSTPVRVNQGANVAGREAYFPWISCDPETGVLSVVFYDDRNVSATQCEVFTACSSDAGTTWTDFKVSDVAFTPAAIPGLADGYMGDYLGITSKGGKVYPCWTDNRGGAYMTYVSPFELGPNARFSASQTKICSGSGVTFENLSTGYPTSWTWDFPGGTPSAFVGKDPPVITYEIPGTYNVSLTVSDGVTEDTETKTGYLTVKNVIAGFSGTPVSIPGENSVTYTDNSSCSPDAWMWSFPGGTPSSFAGRYPLPVTYLTPGTYDVTLIVTKQGGSDTLARTGYITVTPPVFNISNGTVTTCSGTFYDTGGPTGNYLNSETYTETFYPSTAGSKIRFAFSSFTTELNRDTLTIYNGVNSAAPVIGKYHGTAGPGTVTASNAAGALTFRFHSDGSITKTGWVAAVSCYIATNPPSADFSASSTNPLIMQTVTLSDLSGNYPASWSWSFSPASVTFVGGTTSSSQNPLVQFNAPVPYTVVLTSANAMGANTMTKTNYINATTCTISAFPWTEGFENGGYIPTCWSQEKVNNSGLSWIFVAGNGISNPATAHGGTHNACLKDNSSADNKTRLITPALNLLSVSDPQLTFWHTQSAWYGSQDLLSVFYRTSASGTWTLLASYTGTIPSWTRETIALPGVSGDYYIAFEGNARWGHGICLDDVAVNIPDSRVLQNIVVTDPGCFDAAQTISVAGSGTTFIVQDGGSATMVAGQNIIFYPGTTVIPGGYLLGYIAPGGPYCVGPARSAIVAATSENGTKPEKPFFRVYPNPTTGTFTLALNGYVPAEKTSVVINNTKGETIISTGFTDEMKHDFSLEGKPSGLYLIRVVSGSRHGSSRIVKID